MQGFNYSGNGLSEKNLGVNTTSIIHTDVIRNTGQNVNTAIQDLSTMYVLTFRPV